MSLYHPDNIIAEITFAGRAAVSGIRLSGPDVINIVEDFFNRKFPENRYAYFVRHDLDEIVLICYNAPASYTGENVCEIFCHGNPVISSGIITAMIGSPGYNLRTAMPGEFTKRAYFNGKIDLLQAESVVDLINAHSVSEVIYRNRVLKGELSERMATVKDLLMDIAVKSEIEIDFDDENLIDFSYSDAIDFSETAVSIVNEVLTTFANVEKFAEGLRVVITGPVNVGKSTLFNRLIGKNRALTDAEPGTTRDYIEHDLMLEGLDITFTDTAGLRPEGAGNIERMGMDNVAELIENAVMVVEVADSDGYSYQYEGSIRVRNKIDCRDPGEKKPGIIYVSALTGNGVEELRCHVLDLLRVKLKNGTDMETGFLVSGVQKQKISELRSNLVLLISELKNNAQVDVISMLVINCIQVINDILGIEKPGCEVLDLLFSRFCIGK
ncbi:MAG: 50S ribosome-binding GTPase [Oligoflexia bacterium]|nr:50S ribosome-binding GTPase [Oligoflexia bacterium]